MDESYTRKSEIPKGKRLPYVPAVLAGDWCISNLKETTRSFQMSKGGEKR